MKNISIPFLDLKSQHKKLSKDINKQIQICIENSAFIRSQSIKDFENNFSQLTKVNHCISCANGTDALYMAMKSLNIKEGDEIITTAISWISTSETISQAGGKVIFADISEDTFCINPELLQSLITDKTVGIIPVHLYGQPCDMEKILEIAGNNNLWIIEDCAQSHLASIDHRLVGSFGDIATYSFYPSKNLGAMGDAGCIITNNERLAKWINSYSQHGKKNIHEIEGINSRMDGIQASILNVKIKYLNDWTNKRIEIAKFYLKNLKGVGDLKLPKEIKGHKHVYHLFTLQTEYRDDLKKFLSDKGIGTSVNYPIPLPFLPCYSHLNCSRKSFPNALKACNSILQIPLYPELSLKNQNYIVSSIKEFFKNKKKV